MLGSMGWEGDHLALVPTSTASPGMSPHGSWQGTCIAPHCWLEAPPPISLATSSAHPLRRETRGGLREEARICSCSRPASTIMSPRGTRRCGSPCVEFCVTMTGITVVATRGTAGAQDRPSHGAGHSEHMRRGGDTCGTGITHLRQRQLTKTMTANTKALIGATEDKTSKILKGSEKKTYRRRTEEQMSTAWKSGQAELQE